MLVAFFIIAFSFFDRRRKLANRYLKKLSISLKSSTELPSEMYPQITAAISTVLFKKGKNLTEVNNISDAIIHCRGCSGKDIPAGPDLLKELTYFDSYKELFDTKNGTIARKLSELLLSAAEKADEGYLKGSGSQVLNCLTLGHYVPKYEYNIPFKCTITDGVRTCKAVGNVTFSGRDYWDFESLSSNSFWENLVTEKIPEILVNLKGPSVPFGIPFNDSVHYSLTREVKKAEAPATTQPTNQPTSQPATSIVTEKPTIVVTSQPTTVPSSPIVVTSQPTTVPSTPDVVTSQPTTVTVTTEKPTAPIVVTSQPTTIPSTPSVVTSQPTVDSSSNAHDPSFVEPESTGDGSEASSSKSGKKSNKATYIVIAVVCIAAVAVVAFAVTWFVVRRRNLNDNVQTDQIADQASMQMSLIP